MSVKRIVSAARFLTWIGIVVCLRIGRTPSGTVLSLLTNTVCQFAGGVNKLSYV